MSGLVMSMGLAVEVVFGAGGTLGVVRRPVVVFALVLVGFVVVFAVVTFVVAVAIVVRSKMHQPLGGPLVFVASSKK
jgi:hypothetical protein